MTEYNKVPFMYENVSETIQVEAKRESGSHSCFESAENSPGKIDDTERKPRNVTTNAWERFQSLEQRADTISRRAREKRIKHLQKTVIEKVQGELTSDEDRDILREHDVKFGPPVHPPQKATSQKAASQSKKGASLDDVTPSHSSESTEGRTWVEIKQYLDVNSHLLAKDRSSHAPQSGLEKQIEGAIKVGDVKLAEELSDRLSTREFGVRISGAVAARDFLKRKKDEEELGQQKKKKKLPWGFDEKQRWETKGNM